MSSIFENSQILNKYHELIFSKDKSHEAKLKKIINDFAIKNLYKYRSGSEKDFENMIDNQIIFSLPSKFNDVYEFRYKFDYELIKRELDNVIYKVDIIKKLYPNRNMSDNKKEEIYKLLYNKFIEDINRESDRWFVLCLSETYDNLLMWGHYGNNHEGICIEYDFWDLWERNILTPVIYSHEIVSFNSRMNKISTSEFSKFLCTKSIDWQYEKEWRIVKGYNDKTLKEVLDKEGKKIHGIKSYKMPQIKSIYIGCKAKEDVIKRAKEYKKSNPNVNLYKMKISNFEYKLIAEKLDI